MRPIVTRGLTLEPQFASHARAMFALLSDEALYEFENHPPVSLAALRARFKRLESRRSPDGSQQWLNWVIRLHDGDVAGYVQATVHPGGRAALAYVLGSRYWGHGIATRAVAAMMDELRARHGAVEFIAILKSANGRSHRLLQRLGFRPAGEADAPVELEPGEMLMVFSPPPAARPPSR